MRILHEQDGEKPERVIPKFANQDEERKFWAGNDAAEFFDWDRAARPRFPLLKPSG
jgi:hypothetical protein